MTKKIYVDVILHHNKEGQIRPLAIVWANGVKYTIDKVTQITRAASTIAGGTGIRYTCWIQGQSRYLFLKKTGGSLKAKAKELDMCGRYLFKQNDDEELNDWIQKLNLENIADLALREVFPSQKTIVLTAPDTPAIMRWGLKKWDDKSLIINARSEGVKESPFFRDHLAARRCLIKAEAFFEWNKDKQKNIVQGPQQKAVYMAGLYDDSTEIPTFAILTDEAEGDFRKLHNRVPLFIPEAYLQRYIDDGANLLEDFRNLRQIDLTWKNQEAQISLFD